MKKAKDVDEYIAQASKEAQPMLKKIRRIIKTVVPKAEEKINYQIPLYKHHGMLVAYAAFEKHVGLYSLSNHFLKKFPKEVKKYQSGKGTLRFPIGSPLPEELIKKMITLRAKENEAKKN